MEKNRSFGWGVFQQQRPFVFTLIVILSAKFEPSMRLRPFPPNFYFIFITPCRNFLRPLS